MKKIYFLFSFIFFSIIAHGQSDTNSFYFGGIIDHTNSPSQAGTTIGFNFEIPLGESGFLINYHYGLGFNSENNLIYHTPILGGAGMYLLANSGNDDFLTKAGILLILIPEGISYTIYLDNTKQLTPYFNPLGSELVSGGSLVSSKEGGFRLRCSIGKKMYMAPHIGIKYINGNQPWGFSAGISIGVIH